MNFPYLVRFQPVLLSLFRFITGLLLFQYGVAKLFKFPVLPYFANIPPLIYAAGTLELILGALLMIGLFTRLSAFILSGEMAFAYFMGHMFNGETPASCRCSMAAPRRSSSASPAFISRQPAAVRSAPMRRWARTSNSSQRRVLTTQIRAIGA